MMFAIAYINNPEEAIRFYECYIISYTLTDGILSVSI